MCGITGFLTPSSNQSSADLLGIVKRMSGQLEHRGPDDHGSWTDPASGLALGHRRLSVVDLSPEGHQPMVSADDRYVIVFNGEIYNFGILRQELEGLGHTFRGHSDTEVMLNAISQWGVQKATERFVGMFAFALWDKVARVLHLSRDRAGEKPLYYGWSGKTFLFASELKAMKVHPDWNGRIDRSAIALLMRHMYVPTPYSIYEGISKLLPGTILSIPVDNPKAAAAPVSFWDPREIAERCSGNPFTGTDQEALNELDGLLKQVIQGQMIADVPLGAFLSGGIDSSLVVAIMQQIAERPVRTFTIGFHEPGYNEAEFAKAVAAHIGTDHTELYVTPEEAMAVIPKLPSMYDEPFADSSQIPTHLVSQLARKSVTVSLSGDAGDELFGGYNRYFWARNIWGKVGWIPRELRRAAARGITTVSPERWDRAFDLFDSFIPRHLKYNVPGDKLFKLAEVLEVEHPEAMYRNLISSWKNPEELVLGTGESPTVLTDQSQWPKLPAFEQRMMYLDFVSYLPDDILVKVDRAAMATSLETRIPFLDHRVIEFAWRLPLSMKIRDGKGKWLLRTLLHKYVPAALIERPKTGFGVPVETWLRHSLRDWAEDLISEEKLVDQGFFDAKLVRLRWDEHLSGQRNWQYYLWPVLMFQAWLAQERR